FAQVGKTVKVSATLVFPDVNRTAVGLKPGWVLRLEPELNLAFDGERQFQVRQQLLNPTAGGQHKLSCLVLAVGSEHLDTIAVRLPTHYRFGRMEFGTALSRQTEMRVDARFGKKDSRARFPDRDHFVGWLERRETATHLSRSENFVAESMFFGAPLRAGHDCAFRAADHQPAGLSQQGTPGLLFQFCPKFVGALDERYVKRMLEIGFADDARLPV